MSIRSCLSKILSKERRRAQGRRRTSIHRPLILSDGIRHFPFALKIGKIEDMQTLIIGTRSSPLALWQTHWVKQMLEERGHRVVLKEISTSGDRIQKGPLAAHGGKGLFIKELESALLSGEVHLAVHSLKDVPTELAEEFSLAAFLPRADPRDCLIHDGRIPLVDLPSGCRVGSSSPRRISQLLRLNPAVMIENLRGNVGTRMSRVESGDFEATFLAKAGLDRLEISQPRWIHPLDPEEMLPAAGQGIVAIEVLSTSTTVYEAVHHLNDFQSQSSALSERALVRDLQGSCTSPIGGFSEIEGHEMRLRGYVGNLDGTHSLRETLVGRLEDSAELGRNLAEKLNQLGAQDILKSCESS
jgi:hydroxymethylbilane synthase